MDHDLLTSRIFSTSLSLDGENVQNYIEHFGKDFSHNNTVN